MKLGVELKREHSEFVTCVCWAPDGQLISVSDDKDVLRWSADGEKLGKITTLNAFPTSIAWFPTSGKQVQDMFAVSCTDGTVRYISKSGREEKKISAHEGAVIALKWSHDGSALCTTGEDGDVKIWSKNGNLRSTLLSLGQSVYTFSWAPDDDHLVVGNGKVLVIKSIQNNKKNLQWSAHEGIILSCDWNISNNLIVSGSEDCTYKVWDSYGRLLYTSKPMEHFVTSVAWSPNGDYFAVGSFNLLKLCDRVGWTHSRERMNSGSIYNIAFTFDNTQLSAGCGNNCTLFASIVGRRFEYKNIEVTMLNAKRIRVFDNSTDSMEELDVVKDRIVDVALGSSFIVITTLSQCFIYNIGNLNTPIIFDIKAASQFIHMSSKYFLLCDNLTGVNVYNYDGKFVASPKFPNFRAELYTKECIALSNDIVYLLDCVDCKSLFAFDCSSGRGLGKYVHSTDIVKLYCNQAADCRLLAFVDKSSDLYLCLVNTSALPTTANLNFNLNSAFHTYKLQSHVESVIFHDQYNTIVCIADNNFVVFHHPEIAFTNSDLLVHCKRVSESDYGRNAQITVFTGNRVSIRKIDGSIVYANTAVDVSLLDDLIAAGRWDEATRLCRHQKAPMLWATLAALAINKKQLEPAEIALSELGEVAKVEYIQYIKSIPSDEGRNAELLVFRKMYDEAERMLLQASPPLIYRLIKLNIQLYRFQRALDFATRYKTCAEIVLYHRKKYLAAFNREESDPKFLQAFQQIRVDEEDVLRREQQELNDEAQRSSRHGRK